MKVLFSLLILILSTPAQADGLFARAEPEPHWEAIGWLQRDGAGYCTATLIQPHIVLTAAHCLFDADTGRAVALRDVSFHAGWRDGRAAVRRRLLRAAVHPGFDPAQASAPSRIRNDLALIELQLPVRRAVIEPLRLGTHPDPGALVTLVMASDRRAPMARDDCRVLSRQDSALVLSCAVAAGASGSPVVVRDDGGSGHVASVVSAAAMADGRPVALGTDLLGPMRALLHQMRDTPFGNATTVTAQVDR